MKYAFIREHSKHYPVGRLCQVMEVSTSGYYAWRDRPESCRAVQNRRLTTKIALFHKASRGTYGSPRIHRDLLESGEVVGVKRVARLMRSNSIQSKMARRFVITTDSKNTMQPGNKRGRRDYFLTSPSA